jgi:mono/diheme cytochrome c family protein
MFALAVMAPKMRADAVKGADVYKAKCASCHGADGKGETTMGKTLKVKDLASPEIQNQHDSELKTLLENGKGKMPAYKSKLTDEQIESLVQYIRVLKKNKRGRIPTPGETPGVDGPIVQRAPRPLRSFPAP